MNEFSLNPLKAYYQYPFGFLNDPDPDDVDKYTIENILTPIIGVEDLDPGNFPDNISRYIFGRKGEHDELPWNLLCQLNNGVFAYFVAWCDYTGFDCRGGMKLYLAPDLKTLVDMALEEDVRKAYYRLLEESS